MPLSPHRHRLAFLGAWATLALFIAGYPLPARAATVRVFAAASLQDAFRSLGAAYEKLHPGDRLQFNFAGSQLLRVQIEQGAPADVFAGADLSPMRALLAEGRVKGWKVFATNRLVFVGPKRSPIRDRDGLSRLGLQWVLAGPTVPLGRYSEEALALMRQRGGKDAVLANRIRTQVVSRETNARAVLNRVALGEADAGIVYATDAASARGRVRTYPLPPSVTVRAAYPIAVLNDSESWKSAAAFMRLVMSPTGQAILKRHGFLPPPSASSGAPSPRRRGTVSAGVPIRSSAGKH